MKKMLKIILIVLAIIIIAVGSLAVWQRENIKSILIGVNENSEEITSRRNDNQSDLIESLNDYMDVPVRSLTEEEKEKVDSGEISVSDVYMKLFEEKGKELSSENLKEGQSDKNSPSNKGEPSKNEAAGKDEIISRYMAKLYALQSEYTAKAESTISQGAHYYETIKKHKQDPTARAKTISKFTPTVRSIEADCDAKVEKIIADLQNELKSIGEKTDIAGTIRTTYQKEKQLKLSYYANKYLK